MDGHCLWLTPRSKRRRATGDVALAPHTRPGNNSFVAWHRRQYHCAYALLVPQGLNLSWYLGAIGFERFRYKAPEATIVIIVVQRAFKCDLGPTHPPRSTRRYFQLLAAALLPSLALPIYLRLGKPLPPPEGCERARLASSSALVAASAVASVAVVAHPEPS